MMIEIDPSGESSQIKLMLIKGYTNPPLDGREGDLCIYGRERKGEVRAPED